ncbi:MAG TPA: glycosyltransferase family 4 protein [Solirubrobacteraceae bacterium]|jgi:glycosyltransferase involved in cell wall biosynthesis
MRALLISPDPSSNTGGVERFCHLLAAVLKSAGWTTQLIGPTASVPAGLARLGLEPSLQAVSVTRQARAEHADLVIGNGFLGGPAGRRRIHVFHGTMVKHVAAGGTGSRRYRLRQALGGAVPEALCGRGARTVAVSSSTATELERFYRQRVDEVIPNGVDTALFSPGDRATARDRLGLEPDARYALFAGRFEYRKGADLVPDACRQAGFTLLVAGSGAPPSARALGVLSPAELAHAYRAADCVVFPTRYEACSFVVLEALASGVPLLTTPVGWMGDFLRACPSYSSFIVRPERDSIAGALDRVGALASDPPLVLAQAREYVERHNGLDAFGARWLELISEVVGG